MCRQFYRVFSRNFSVVVRRAQETIEKIMCQIMYEQQIRFATGK